MRIHNFLSIELYLIVSPTPIHTLSFFSYRKLTCSKDIAGIYESPWDEITCGKAFLGHWNTLHWPNCRTLLISYNLCFNTLWTKFSRPLSLANEPIAIDFWIPFFFLKQQTLEHPHPMAWNCQNTLISGQEPLWTLGQSETNICQNSRILPSFLSKDWAPTLTLPSGYDITFNNPISKLGQFIRARDCKITTRTWLWTTYNLFPIASYWDDSFYDAGLR